MNKEQLLKLKTERIITIIIAICLLPIGLIIVGICFAFASPFGILGMFCLAGSFILTLRSFFHEKFYKLNQRIAECDNKSEAQTPVKTKVKRSNLPESKISTGSFDKSQQPQYLNDVTFIKEIKHTPTKTWHQYNILFESRIYGWDMMKDWADYMTSSDLKNISQVTTGSLGTADKDITKSYLKNGSKCKQTPELASEMGMLSIAGMSTTLKSPVKIVWFNQTRVIRIFAPINNKLQIIQYAETVARRTFGTNDAMKLGKPITTPVKFEGTNIYINSKDFFVWKEFNKSTLQFELRGALQLKKKEPIINLYEDGIKTREYRLQTEGDENFTGKYFLISVRLGMLGTPSVPIAQIDGFISDTPAEREITLNDVGYRMEGHFLACGRVLGQQRYEMNRGQDLMSKALKYPGYTTPSNVRLIGICPECQKSFAFHGYAFYMVQSDVAYSDDGLDCCEIQAYNIDKNTWEYTTDGKTFRYYNSFNCPHCGTPYIDYKKYPQNKVFGVSGCVHLSRKPYQAK